MVLPQYQSVYVGEIATFICSSENMVNWRFNDGILPHNAVKISKYQDYRLTIVGAQLNNTGKYTCIGEGLHQMYFEDHGELYVKCKLKLSRQKNLLSLFGNIIQFLVSKKTLDI